MPLNNGVPSGTLFVQTADVTVASTASETPLNGSGVGSLTLPVNFLKSGKTIRIRARGYITDTGTPTFNVRVKFGSTTILTTGTITFTGDIFNNEWQLEGDITCRTTGVSGTVAAQGVFEEEPTGSCPSENSASMTNTSTVTVNTTTTQAITVTFQWGTSSLSNTITCTHLTVDAVGTISPY
jgi:hypothetical protein